MLVTRVETQRQATGIVVGIVDSTGRRIISYGTPGTDDQRPMGGDAVFDVGSITKVLTALLLSDMVQRGEVALDDRVTKLLAAEDLSFLGRGEREFFLKIVDAQITFESSGDGRATVAIWHQSGQAEKGQRIE